MMTMPPQPRAHAPQLRSSATGQRLRTRRWRALTGYLAGLLAMLVSPVLDAAPCYAEARFVLTNLDAPGEGFNDPTPVAPVGGNDGQTLGEQRQIAVQYAADLWGAVLESDVDIVVAVNFEALGCDTEAAILATAAPSLTVEGLRARWADPGLMYPSALADRLLGEDAAPGSPDIVATFNSSIDVDCGASVRWYYGLDGDGDDTDLVQTALHEFAHGLGMVMLVDADTGSLLLGTPDPLTALAYDHLQAATLDTLDDASRLQSLKNVRQVVFKGERTRAEALRWLQTGTPALGFTPQQNGLSGYIADSNLGTTPLGSLEGPLLLGSPDDACSPVWGARGRFVLLKPACSPERVIQQLASSGALGLLIALPTIRQSPPVPLDLPSELASSLPVLTLSYDDGELLTNAMASQQLEAHLDVAVEQRLGLGPDGYLLLNATDPITTSVLSHWDSLARPNLLMEPFVGPKEDRHTLDLTVSALEDLGWASPCGDGVQQAGEECDDGSLNSNSTADACRTDCSRARCGDGIVDSGEACDDGVYNGDEATSTCTASCEPSPCATGALDCGPTTTPTAPAATSQDTAGTFASEPEPLDDLPTGGLPLGAPVVPATTPTTHEDGCGCRIGPASTTPAGPLRLAVGVLLICLLPLRRAFRNRQS